MSKKPTSKSRGKKAVPKRAQKPVQKRAQKLASELAREQEQFFGTEDVAGTAAAMDVPLEVATPFPAPQSGSDMGQSDDLLIRARAAWEMGDWAVLARLDAHPLETHPARGKLALLASVGLAQMGDMARARDLAQKAQSWGCPARLMAQVLIGGVMNSLGRVGCLLQDDTRARHYFESSIACVNPKADAVILGRARDINEKLALGLLPEAAAALNQSLDQMTADQSIPSGQAEIFRIQMDLLSGSLALAQQRHQLSPDAGLNGTADQGDKNRANSQLGQDLWVLEQTGFKRDGFFVEFGATDGVLLSNTLLLEADYGWNGICAEPNPQFFAKLRHNRNCRVGPDCIMGQTGKTVEFILADEFGGAAEFADYDSHAPKRAAFRDSGEMITLQSISLDDFLKKYDAPRTIDYLSIDTEGSEYEILKAFPFEDWDIRLLTVEHNFTPIREDIRILLEGHGYIRTKMQWDDWYAKAPVTPRLLPRAELKRPFVIAAAGVPRSGSTWVYNACRLLCEQADISCYATWFKEYAPERHAEYDIHLVKLHEIADLTFTPHRILTTRRDLVDRLASLLHMGWLDDDPKKIRHAAELATDLDSLWALKTNCETQYEDIVHQPRQAILEIAQVLEITCNDAAADAIAVQLDRLSVPESTGTHDPTTLLHPNHRATKSQRKKSQSIIRAALAG